MTKSDLVALLCEQAGLSRKEGAAYVESVFTTIKAGLSEGKNVKVSGFGTFTVRSKGARLGRNPKTGEAIAIAPRKVVVFKASEHFKRQVDRRGEDPSDSGSSPII